MSVIKTLIQSHIYTYRYNVI